MQFAHLFNAQREKTRKQNIWNVLVFMSSKTMKKLVSKIKCNVTSTTITVHNYKTRFVLHNDLSYWWTTHMFSIITHLKKWISNIISDWLNLFHRLKFLLFDCITKSCFKFYLFVHHISSTFSVQTHFKLIIS